MINLHKKELAAIIKFCGRSNFSNGISYFGNAIEASNGSTGIRIQQIMDGIKEEKVRIPKAALVAALAAMDKDDIAVITADGIKVNSIHIDFEPLTSMLFDDLTHVFNNTNDGIPDKFLMFNTTNQNTIGDALNAFGIKGERDFGNKERVLFISGNNDFFYVQVCMSGISVNDRDN